MRVTQSRAMVVFGVEGVIFRVGGGGFGGGAVAAQVGDYKGEVLEQFGGRLCAT